MHFLLSRSIARANAEADTYQHKLDSISAVARRRETASPAPERRSLPDDCPSTGEGFVWQAHDPVPEKTSAAPSRRAKQGLAPIIFLIIASLCIGSTWEPGDATPPRTTSQPRLSGL